MPRNPQLSDGKIVANSHNSADSTTDMNALLHSSLYADPLFANDRLAF